MNGRKVMLVLDRIPKLLFLQFPHQPFVLISGQQILTSPKFKYNMGKCELLSPSGDPGIGLILPFRLIIVFYLIGWEI